MKERIIPREVPPFDDEEPIDVMGEQHFGFATNDEEKDKKAKCKEGVDEKIQG